MPVVGFDHVSLPSSDVRRLTAFYRRLGFGVVGEEEWLAGKARIVSVTFGDNKINIHPETMVTARNDTLRGPSAEPGCGDICFVWEGGHRALLELLNNIQVSPLAGPVK